MTLAQAKELETLLTSTLKSTTIEWALNLRVCDLLEASPDLAPSAMRRLSVRLRKERPVSVLLALGLLEMIVKNCGLAVCRYADSELADAMVSVVKTREGVWYSLGRNLHKSGASGWLPKGVGIGASDRKLWVQASRKVLELLQLWTDAFLLQEAQLVPIFGAYKSLRQEGYNFPRSERGVSSGLCLVAGGTESPAFQAGACVPADSQGSDQRPRSTSAASEDMPRATSANSADLLDMDAPPLSDTAATSAASLPASALASSADASRAVPVGQSGRAGGQPPSVAAEIADMFETIASYREDLTRSELAQRLRVLRLRAADLIQAHTEAEGTQGVLERDDQLEELFRVIEDIDSTVGSQHELAGAGSASSSSAAPQLAVASSSGDAPQAPQPTLPGASADVDAAGFTACVGAVPPPPSSAPPDKEQQELYDAILAKYLQDREDMEYRMQTQAHIQDDAMLALRLSLGMADDDTADQPSAPMVVYCIRCRCPNEVQGHSAGNSHGALRRFACYSCGLQQETQPPRRYARHSSGQPEAFRADRRRMSGGADAFAFAPEPRPQRHAPPARVITAPETAPELFIGAIDEDESDVRPGSTSKGEGASASASMSAALRSAGESMSASMFGSAGAKDASPLAVGGTASANSESLLGSGFPSSASKASKAWAKSTLSSMSSIAAGFGGSSGSDVKRLGDGTPQTEFYAEMDDGEAGAPLCGAGPPASSASKSWLPSGSFLWSSGKASTGEAEEPLIDRVRVNEEWELIRPPEGRPYWHNSVTEASQWEPPECVVARDRR